MEGVRLGAVSLAQIGKHLARWLAGMVLRSLDLFTLGWLFSM